MAEAELKLRFDPADEAAIRRSPALAGIRPRHRRLLAIYFDAPGGELAARGMVLRLRREGRRWVQALKTDSAASGGLHVRQEWEYASRDPVLDLARFAGTPLAAIDDAATLHRRLAPAFRVEMARTTWVLEPVPGSRLEVAMDRGNAEGGGRSEPICELEIECLEGGLGPAFELARRLLDAAPLHPSAVTKAERGYRLARGEATRPAKAHPIRLARGFAPEQAARAVIAAGLAQLQANEEGVLADGDPEFIHQARIALRRLRSALRMFRQTLGEERARQWRDALGEVARALGEARDWDVFATATFPALARAHGDARMARTLAARAARLRRASHEAARAALRSHAYARVVLDLTAWLVLGEPEAAGRDGLAQFAARTLGKRHKRLLRDAARLPTLEAAERHRVRIDVKRLRYGTDALASLFKSRRVDEYREALDALQDALGEANDAATALVLLPRLEPPEGFAAFARGWLGARSRGDSAYLQALLGRLARVRRFWAG